MAKCCVLSAVRAECLNIIQISFMLQRVEPVDIMTASICVHMSLNTRKLK
jgi:hypothetical protein